ncbi:MAG: hypothetical protein JW881_19355 [Spirochaetales bacterium]|nr:hypothetical protein [Spirochaetales bacterium]
MKKDKIIIIFICFFLPGFTLLGYSQDNSDKGKTPKIAFIPFEYTTAVGEEIAWETVKCMAQTMHEQKIFEPFSIREWLDSAYKEDKAENVATIIKRIKEAGFEVDFLCHGIVFKINNKTGLKITIYPLDDSLGTTYYMRFFKNSTTDVKKTRPALLKACKDIAEEISLRYDGKHDYLAGKNIYIKRSNIYLIYYTEVEATKTPILTQVNYTKLNGTDIMKSDHFFHELLLYSFHTTGLFKTGNDNMGDYLYEYPLVSDDYDYVVNTDILLSKSLNVLMVSVMDNKSGELIISYNYPFVDFTLESLAAIMRKNSFIIALSILSEKEKLQVGLAEIPVGNGNNQVYCNDYYLGTESQDNLLLPFGENNIRIGNGLYKMFVLPYTKNNQYWSMDDSIISQMINVVSD